MILRHLTYANVVATLALFIALGGTSYAALVVTGASVRDGSLTGKDLRDSSVRGIDVLNGTLTLADLADGAEAALRGTGSQILARLGSVDGAGSGLDADLLDGRSGEEFATANSVDSFVQSLKEPGTVNDVSNPVAWSRLKGVPSDIVDGDQDTTYRNGSGLALQGDTFSVSFGGSGKATTAARSDHSHWGDMGHGDSLTTAYTLGLGEQTVMSAGLPGLPPIPPNASARRIFASGQAVLQNSSGTAGSAYCWLSFRRNSSEDGTVLETVNVAGLQVIVPANARFIVPILGSLRTTDTASWHSADVKCTGPGDGSVATTQGTLIMWDAADSE